MPSKKRPRRRVPYDFSATADATGKERMLTVAELSAGDIIEIETLNHRYRVEVLDPASRAVRVTSDGPHVTEPTDMVLSGSLLVPFGSSIMIGRVAVGHCIEFGRPGKSPMTLTPARSVTLNGVRILPRAPGGTSDDN